MKIPLRNSAMLTFLAAALAGNVHAQFGATAASQTPEAREAAARATAAKIQQASAQPTPRTPDGHPDLTGYWAPANGGKEEVFGPQRSLDPTGKQPVSFISEDDEINGDAGWRRKHGGPTSRCGRPINRNSRRNRKNNLSGRITSILPSVASPRAFRASVLQPRSWPLLRRLFFCISIETSTV